MPHPSSPQNTLSHSHTPSRLPCCGTANKSPTSPAGADSRKGCRFGAAHICPHQPPCAWTDPGGTRACSAVLLIYGPAEQKSPRCKWMMTVLRPVMALSNIKSEVSFFLPTVLGRFAICCRGLLRLFRGFDLLGRPLSGRLLSEFGCKSEQIHELYCMNARQLADSFIREDKLLNPFPSSKTSNEESNSCSTGHADNISMLLQINFQISGSEASSLSGRKFCLLLFMITVLVFLHRMRFS